MQKLVFRNAKGIEIDLTSAQSGGNWGIVDWSGLSDVSMNIQSQQVPFQDGSVFLDALMQDRDIAVTVAYNDEKDLAQRYELRRELISVLNPKLGEGVLIYTNDFLSKQITCIPNMPIFANKNSDEGGTNKVDVSFHCCNPYWEDLEETEITSSLTEKGIAINTGDVPAQVEMVIDTSYVKNLQIYNEANGKKLRFPEELTTRTFIDTNLGRKSVNDFERLYDVVGIGNTILDITYSEEKELYVAVGVAGTIITSKYGENWYASNFQKTNVKVWCVIYVESLHKFFIGTDDSNSSDSGIYSSSDGINWEMCLTRLSIIKLVYSEKINTIIALSKSGASIKVSTDGVNWESKPITTGNTITPNDIAYIDTLDMIIMVGKSGFGVDIKGAITISSDMGDTWTKYEITQNGKLNSIDYSKYTGSIYIGGENGVMYTSTDGVNWESMNGIPQNFTTQKIRYNETVKKIIATGDELIDGKRGMMICFLNDGSTYWQYSGVPTLLLSDTSIYNINYNPIYNKYIIVGTGMYSSSILWEGWQEIYAIQKTINKCIYSEEKELYVAVGDDGEIYTSENGKNWSSHYTMYQDTVKKETLLDVIYANDLDMFIAVGENNTIVISNNGYDWECVTEYFEERNWRTIIKTNSGYYTLNELGRPYAGVSTDGVNWDINVINYPNPSETREGVIFVNNKYYSVDGKNIRTSTDGIDYATTIYQFPFHTLKIRSIIYSSENNLFVAVGYGEKTLSSTTNPEAFVFTSRDGENWMVKSFQGDIQFTNITYNENYKLFIITTNVGLIYTSKDGNDWSAESVGSGVYYTSYLLDYEHLFIGGKLSLLSHYSKSQNKMDKLSADSDMTFNLEQGENPIRISYTNGEAEITLKFKNKYIGV